MFELVSEPLPGCWLVDCHGHSDQRGLFLKTYTKTLFKDLNIHCEFEEDFYSISKKDTIRGLHFQLPPFDHVKIVHCISGHITDVLVDLRSGAGYGNTVVTELSNNKPQILIVGRGVAHGFVVRSAEAITHYKTSTKHEPTHDVGINWQSINIDWHCDQPIVSARDQQHVNFDEFITPF